MLMLSDGQCLSFETPDPSCFTIENIATGLSNTCRYNGQLPHPRFLSVAEHSVIASYLYPQNPLHALLHDASEAFLGDVPTGLKSLLPEYIKIEKNFEEIIASIYNIPSYKTPLLDEIDLSLLMTEVEQSSHNPNSQYWPQNIPTQPAKIRFLLPLEARSLFLTRYYELTKSDPLGFKT